MAGMTRHSNIAAAMQLVTVKATGAAKLEAARAETAALRALANAGKLLDAHPALAQLQLVQRVPYGSKVVLALGSVPLPVLEERIDAFIADGGQGLPDVTYN